jgi:hypothetical protein
MTRSEQDRREEAAAIIAAQIANASQRDAFAALGHTVLFTASIAFMGDVRPAAEIEWHWLVFVAWASSVLGLFALTLSFQLADSAAEKRIKALHDEGADDHHFWLNVWNFLALWTFPVSMLATAGFAAKNLWSIA